jgi:Mg-chelatase subunit ChlD
MKNNLTELVFILDRSGSMAGFEKDTIGGFNSMIEMQKRQDGKVYVSTTFLDAVGGAIHHIGNVHKYARPEDVPEHTVFIITTDGMENASHNFTRSRERAVNYTQDK